MLSVLCLPDDIVLTIFKHLSPDECSEIITNIQDIHIAQPFVDKLYQRLLSGKLLITNDQPNHRYIADYQLTLEKFQNKFLDTSVEALMFRSTRPNYMEFNFTRQHCDYMNFIYNLKQFHELLKDPNCQEYFRKVLQVNMYLDANLVLIENPDNLTAIVIKSVLELSDHPELACKVKHLTIKAGDIGNMCVPQWSLLLPKFTSLVSLNMSQNLLKSNYGQYLDVWGRQEKFPNGLKSLNLNYNMLTYVSKQFLSCLPHTLEELLMNQNDIELVENCDLGLLLPNLRRWELNYTKLSVINPQMIISCKTGFTLELMSTYLPQPDINELQRIAHEKSLHIIV
ncbi:hypothetical protein MG5_05559 [Candida albicans P57072]|uniref:F-box domain-containing protein n=2 Tax=Candida albicans TaxID=5476 RepID=A0A8H6C5J3_CANAX|nr:hypothetical protein FOB64_000116 [Candida albicans]KGQ82827.1 hypothetical protein MEU_05576 [Candida albicans P37005]KGQ83962.1 hypothetical protein MG1_05604 [Candida albicans GC75]KGR01702.1 hypothetical protein MG5_05559 [Candida albicans P57072]KGR04469.1 hypothetical protein MG3_05597 [Candida albicans P78048]KGR07046.1 hypothetical protein MG9_05593 [Candida albicans P37037]KGT64328.1 hypothetical protein MEK_05584 [Candida albicans 12C]KHC29598.1 hypothetical protein MGO_05530 [C